MKRRALIVERDPSVSRFLDRALRTLGWEPVCAVEFDEAMDAYEAGHYQLVLCELELNGDGGLLLAKAFRSGEPELALILTCSSHAGLGEAIAAGISHFLIKPFAFGELREVIEAALDAPRYSR